MKIKRETAISDLKGLKRSATRRFMQHMIDGTMTKATAERVLASVQYAIELMEDPNVIKQLQEKK